MKIHELIISNEFKAVISLNIKWVLSVAIRVFFFIILISISIFIGKTFGLIKTTDDSIKSQITIKQDGIINISKASKIDYLPDEKDIDDTIALLKKHKESLKKEKTNVKKTN